MTPAEAHAHIITACTRPPDRMMKGADGVTLYWFAASDRGRFADLDIDVEEAALLLVDMAAGKRDAYNVVNLSAEALVAAAERAIAWVAP